MILKYLKRRKALKESKLFVELKYGRPTNDIESWLESLPPPVLTSSFKILNEGYKLLSINGIIGLCILLSDQNYGIDKEALELVFEELAKYHLNEHLQ